MYKFPHTDCGVQAKLFCLSRADQTELILKLRAAYPGSYAPDEWLGMDDPLRYDAVRTWRLAIISCDGDHAARETVRDHSRWIMSRTAEIEPNEYIRLLAQAYSACGSVYGATD